MRKIIALTSVLVIACSLIAGKHLWKGNTIYDEQWNKASAFHFGVALVTKYGATYFINEDNERIQGHGYDEVVSLNSKSESSYKVRIAKKWGIVDRDNKIITDLEFDSIYTLGTWGDIIIVSKNNKIGILNKHYEYLVPCIADEVVGLDHRSITVRISNQLKAFSIVPHNTLTINHSKEDLIYMNANIARVRVKHEGKWGIIGYSRGAQSNVPYWLAPPIYDTIKHARNNLYKVSIDNKYGIIQANNDRPEQTEFILNGIKQKVFKSTTLVPIKYDAIKYAYLRGTPNDGNLQHLVACKTSQLIIDNKETTTNDWLLLGGKESSSPYDAVFERVTSQTFADAQVFADPYNLLFLQTANGWCQFSSKTGKLDESNFQHIESRYTPPHQFIFDLSENFVRYQQVYIQQDQQWRTLNGNSKWDKIQSIDNQSYGGNLVQRDTKWGLITPNDKIICYPEWDEIKKGQTNIYTVRKGDHWYFVRSDDNY